MRYARAAKASSPVHMKKMTYRGMSNIQYESCVPKSKGIKKSQNENLVAKSKSGAEDECFRLEKDMGGGSWFSEEEEEEFDGDRKGNKHAKREEENSIAAGPMSLDELVAGQKADGSWHGDNSFYQSLLKQFPTDLQKKIVDCAASSQILDGAHFAWLVTYLCRLLLRTKFAAQNGEWSNLDAKAGRWLNTYNRSQQQPFSHPLNIAAAIPLPV